MTVDELEALPPYSVVLIHSDQHEPVAAQKFYSTYHKEVAWRFTGDSTRHTSPQLLTIGTAELLWTPNA